MMSEFSQALTYSRALMHPGGLWVSILHNQGSHVLVEANKPMFLELVYLD